MITFLLSIFFFFFQAEDGIRDYKVTGVQTCALPIWDPMRVFLTGATGYVGFAVATALRRAGHDVYGLTRAAAKVPQLARQEIRPVIGDIGDPKSYADTAEECSVLVHAAFESSASAAAKDKTAVDALI